MSNPDKSERYVKYTLYAGFGALVVFSIWLQWFWSSTSMDIDVYWEAGARMLHGGANLYAESEDPVNRVGDYIYPPLFAGLFAPLTVLPRSFGYALWGLAQLGMLVASLRLVRGAVGVESASRRAFYLLMALGISGAIWTNFQEGQVNLLLVMTLAGGLLQLERGRTFTGGLLLASAAHLKVIPIVLLPLLIAQKRFKAAGAMAGGMALLWLVPLVYTVPTHGLQGGFATNAQMTGEFYEVVVSPRLDEQYARDLGGARAPNNSLPGVMQRYFDDDHALSLHTEAQSPLIAPAPAPVVKYAGLLIGAVLGALAMLLAWWRRDSRQARVASIGLGLLAGAMANLLFWPHHLCLMLLALGPLAASGFKRGDMRLTLMAVGALMLFAYSPLLDRLAFFDWMAILGLPTLGVLAVWFLTFIHFLRRPIEAPPATPILRAHEEEKARAAIT